MTTTLLALPIKRLSDYCLKIYVKIFDSKLIVFEENLHNVNAFMSRKTS